MTLLLRTSAIALMLSLGGCMGGLLGGGKAPTTLVTLTPAAADPGQIARTAGARPETALLQWIENEMAARNRHFPDHSVGGMH